MNKQQVVATIAERVSEWPGVTVEPHRFGGLEFRFHGKAEVGHVHLGGLTDVPLSRPLRDEVIERGLAHPHHLLKDSGWISYWVRNDDDVEQAVRLLRLSYLRYLNRTSEADAQEMQELLTTN